MGGSAGGAWFWGSTDGWVSVRYSEHDPATGLREAQGTELAPILFGGYFGSYFGDWDEDRAEQYRDNNFLKAQLTVGLATIWEDFPADPLALGMASVRPSTAAGRTRPAGGGSTACTVTRR